MMDEEALVRYSVACPLYRFKSGILSPRGIYTYKELFDGGVISKDAYRQAVEWCDLCGLCSPLYEFVRGCWEEVFEYDHTPAVEVVEEGVKQILLPRKLYEDDGISKAVGNLIERLGSFEFEVGVTIYDGFPDIYINSSIKGFREIRKAFRKDLLSKGVDDILVLDRYTFELVGMSVKFVTTTPSKLVSDILTRRDVYPLKTGVLKVNLLNSNYKFYRRELLTLSRYIRIIPQLHVVLSSDRYGFGFAPLYEEYNEYFKAYLDVHLPYTAYIISTVDPMVYMVLRRVISRRYAVSYLPLLVLNILRMY